MQFSEVSELEQFNKHQLTPQISFFYRHPNPYIPIRTLQDLNLFELHDILENSLQIDPSLQRQKSIKLGSSHEKTEDILRDIQGFVSKSELKPLEQLKKSRNHGEFIENDNPFDENLESPCKQHDINKNRLRSQRAVSEDLLLVNSSFREKNEDCDEIKSNNHSSETLENNEEESLRKKENSQRVRKRFSFNWLEDDSKKKFKKVTIDFEQNKSRSLLSEQIYKIPKKKNGRLTRFSLKAAPNSKLITVFFFSTPLSLKVPININNSVQDVIITVICFYMTSQSVDHSLMKYPYVPEAYELRILEDDDDYRPEMSFDPLEKSKKFGEYGIEQVAFCEIEGFKTSNVFENEESKELENREKQDEFLKLFGPENQKILIQIHIPHQNFSTLMRIEPNKQIKDIFPHLQKKVKFDEKKFKVFTEVGPMDEEGVFSTEDQELDINMPLANLKKNKLKIMKRTFADDGDLNNNNNNNLRNSRHGDLCEDKDSINCPETVVLSEIQAVKYEEFELIKVDLEKNKKNIRILAIGQFKIYQKFKEKPQSCLHF